MFLSRFWIKHEVMRGNDKMKKTIIIVILSLTMQHSLKAQIYGNTEIVPPSSGISSAGSSQAELGVSTDVLVAPTPPMGWNSYDAFGSSINESEFRNEVRYIKSHLLRYGWQYAVIDYLWFNPTNGPNIRLDVKGAPLDSLAMDKYGRLMPAINRFPSASNGIGFRKIADFVHNLGLKFGIHIMRGIPREAYWDNTPIKGTSYTAQDIADTASKDLCRWNNNMYGVDPSKPGAQEYYNSIFDLYAQWGVDLVKVDDISSPYHKEEIEMVRKAINQCGRPMVLSLSPGPAPLVKHVNLSRNANMWRISNDMWDTWKQLKDQFELLDKWSPYIQENHWPDADMLPIGRLSVNNLCVGPDRISRFTKDETYTLLTLWSIARSPLIMGGELLTTPQWVISLLQNKEVINVDQHSTDNHQVYRNDSEAVWMARGQAGTIYLAVFNLKDNSRTITITFVSVPGVKQNYRVRDLWQKRVLGIYYDRFKITIGPHGARLLKLVPAT
jgi:alpha-galactosidase